RKKLVGLSVVRKIAGVALGLSEFFDLDVTLVRLVWVLAAIFGGCGLLAYIVGWIVMPSEPQAFAMPAASVQPSSVQQTARSRRASSIRERALKVVLALVGRLFLGGVYPTLDSVTRCGFDGGTRV